MRRSTVPRYAQSLQPRAAPKKLHRHVAFRRIKHLVFALLIIISAAFIGLTLQDYHQSLDWSKNKNGLKMAEMSPDMLQDSPKQIAIKEDFLKRADKMVQADGQINVTQSDLVALKQDLQKIKTAKPQYEKRYQQIADKYMVQSILKSLTKNNVVRANEHQVNKALITVGPILTSIHQKYPHDKFVAQQMQIVHNLNHDMQLIKQLLGNTAQLVTIDHRTATFKPEIIYDNYEKAISPEDKLVYKWSMLVPLTNLQNDTKRILTKQAQKINLYNAYKKDLRDKDQAYEDLRKARATHEANNAQVIEQIRQDKIAKERQKEAEEAERRRQAEEEKQQQQQKDNDDTDNDDDSKSNNSDKNQTSKPSKSDKPKSNKQKANNNKPKKKPKDHYIDPDNDNYTDTNNDS